MALTCKEMKMLNAKNTGIGSRMFRSQYLTISSGRIEQKLLPMMFAPAVVEMTIAVSVTAGV
ncbi:hypothetical protein BXD91_19425 [Salmonella enterica subsp. enterica serovar Muenchen]|nr:hypothetical protein [Salmonella enterica subsp. enterica serovar Muenchen]